MCVAFLIPFRTLRALRRKDTIFVNFLYLRKFENDLHSTKNQHTTHPRKINEAKRLAGNAKETKEEFLTQFMHNICALFKLEQIITSIF